MARKKRQSTDSTKIFSERLEDLIQDEKKQENVKLTEVAQRIGVSPASLSEWCSDCKTPTIDALVKIANHYNVSTDYLLGLDSDSKRKPSAANELGLSQASVDTAIRWRLEEPELTQILDSLISEPELIQAVANLKMVISAYQTNDIKKLIPYLKESRFRDNVTEKEILADYYDRWKTSIQAEQMKAIHTFNEIVLQMASSSLAEIQERYMLYLEYLEEMGG